MRKIYQAQFLVILWLQSTRHLLQHNVTKDSVFVIHHVVPFYFSIFHYFCVSIIFVLSTSRAKQNDSDILVKYTKMAQRDLFRDGTGVLL